MPITITVPQRNHVTTPEPPQSHTEIKSYWINYLPIIAPPQWPKMSLNTQTNANTTQTAQPPDNLGKRDRGNSQTSQPTELNRRANHARHAPPELGAQMPADQKNMPPATPTPPRTINPPDHMNTDTPDTPTCPSTPPQDADMEPPPTSLVPHPGEVHHPKGDEKEMYNALNILESFKYHIQGLNSEHLCLKIHTVTTCSWSQAKPL